MISFTVNLSEDDYYEFLLHKEEQKLAKQTKTQQFRSKFLSSLVIGVPLCSIIGLIRGWQAAGIIFGVYIVVINVLPLLGGKLKRKPNRLYTNMIRTDARKIMNNPKYKDSFAPCQHLFSDSGIVLSQKQEKTEISWESITNMSETERLILLEAGSEMTLILPKSQIVDLPALKTLFTKKLSLQAEFGKQIEP